MHDLRLNQLTYRTEGKLCRVVLNRPESLNAFSVELVAELDAVSQVVEDDRSIRVVAITGSGRAFSAGIDLKALSRGEIDHAYLVQWERFLHRLETMDKIVVCLCHGYFIGVGGQHDSRAAPFVYDGNAVAIGVTEGLVRENRDVI